MLRLNYLDNVRSVGAIFMFIFLDGGIIFRPGVTVNNLKEIMKIAEN